MIKEDSVNNGYIAKESYLQTTNFFSSYVTAKFVRLTLGVFR